MLTMNGRDAREWAVFDPTDIPRLFAQDEVLERGWTTGFSVPCHERTNDELAVETVALRNALLLPLSEPFLAFIEARWQWACEEISRRMYPGPMIWMDVVE